VAPDGRAPDGPAPDFAGVRRREFPHLHDRIHLNSASYAPTPKRALDAMAEFQERRAAATLQPDDFGAVLDRARRAAAGLVGAEVAEIGLVPNTSVGLNHAAAIARQRAQRQGSGARRTILLSEGEFPANVYCWMALERDGFRVHRVPARANGCPDEDALLDLVLRGDVAVLTVSAVQFATGFLADLSRLGRACRETDTLFVVDGIQAVGVTPVAVHVAAVDILATGGHKWLCGPFGSGFLYIRHELAMEHEPDLPGWLAFESSMDFERLLSYAWDLFPDARRYETGSLPVQDYAGLAAAMELLLELGVSRVRQHVRSLQAPLLEWAAGRGVEAVPGTGDRTAGILCLRLAGAHALQSRLDDAGISVVPREGSIRFAPHFFNTIDEVGRVVECLDQAT